MGSHWLTDGLYQIFSVHLRQCPHNDDASAKRCGGSQVDTAASAEQVKTNPARFQSALSMLEGEILLIPGGTPLIIDNVVVGGVGSAGPGGDGDVRAVKAAIAAWGKVSPESPLATIARSLARP
jgi:Haem degrading protein HbpS-like